jgi:hypothetical protein
MGEGWVRPARDAVEIARHFSAGDAVPELVSPGGTAEGSMNSRDFSRPSGTEPTGAWFPALKCRAISRLPLRGADNIRLQAMRSQVARSHQEWRGIFFRQFVRFAVLVWFIAAPWLSAVERHDVIVVVGAPGEAEYATRFQAWTATWRQAGERAQAKVQVIGSDPLAQVEDADKDALHRAIVAAAAPSTAPLWIVLIGHGTYDGRMAKFNLRGSDVAAQELAGWLDGCARPVVLLNTAPASAPFLLALSRPGRVVISATKSGREEQATRFGGFVAEAIGKADADLDQDGQVSVLEVFLYAARAVEASYKQDGLIVTEHPLLDDNGDGRGTRADWFQGVWAVKTAADGATVDGIRAHQIHLLPSEAERQLSVDDQKARDQLEQDLATLRTQRKTLSEDEYYRQLEGIMRKLSAIYQRASESKIP